MRVSNFSWIFLGTTAAATYVLEDDYSPALFAGMFDFFTVSGLISC